MSASVQSRVGIAAVVILVMLGGGRLAAQQSSLAGLPEEPPEVVLYRIGPVLVDPRLSIPEIGRDSNIFNEANAPQEDFVIKLLPEVDFFSDLGLLRIAVRSGSTITYFHRNDSERSIAEQVRGRATVRLSRFKPWVGGASIRSNERSSEIDARAKRVTREAAAGVQFDVSPLAALTVSGNRLEVQYADAERYRDTPLAAALDRRTETLAAALRFQATPLTALTFRGYTSRDDFAFDPERDSTSEGGDVEVSFGSEAIIRGRAAVGYRQQRSEDPTIATFRGITGRGGVTAPLLWRAMVDVQYVRDVQYSFDRREGFFVENGGDLTYTQRVGGPFDLQGRVSRYSLNYDASEITVPRTEVLWSYQGGIGYSLESGSRFGLSYEVADRDSTVPDRTFARRRLFGSFTYEFWK
jgi:hypothetical protein